jgi:hypothetical protein
MSVPFGPAVLTLGDITKQIRSTFEQFTDPRRGKNTRHTRVDAGLSAFSVFFMQGPSFLDYRRSLDHALGRNNAQTLFGVHEIPSDDQIRHLLDATEPNQVRPLFPHLFNALNQAGVVETYRSVNQTPLLASDGVEHFPSRAIHCPNRSIRQHANGSVAYGHTALTPVPGKPGLDQVIPPAPEFVRPQDGAEKQDRELNAAQRWLAGCGDDYGPLNVTLLGDDLYGREPCCRAVLDRGMGFILVCKPASHPLADEWLAFLERGGAVRTVVRRRRTGQRRETDTYRHAHAIPLRDGDGALPVNWCELTTTGEKGEALHHSSFATSWAPDDRKVPEVVEAGRSRWKIENENNNTDIEQPLAKLFDIAKFLFFIKN